MSADPADLPSRRRIPGLVASDSICADSCSSLDEQGKEEPGFDEESGVIWKADTGSHGACHDNSSRGHGSSDPRPTGDEADPPCDKHSRGWMQRCMPKSSMQSLAVLCMLLTLGTIIVPRGDWGVDGLVAGVVLKRQQASMRASHASAFIPHRFGKRQCRPLKPGRTTPRVTIEGRGVVYNMSRLTRTGRWQVPARKDGLLSIMTPVFPDNATLSLLTNQLRSANKFMDMETFHEWMFVTPPEKVDTLVDYLEEQVALLPCLLADKIRVLPDDQCSPVLHQWRLKKIAGDREVSGWTKQQLVKLGCSQAISTPYYLITDADTFFMRKLQALNLVKQKECKETSGVCDIKEKVAFQARNEMQPPITGDMQMKWERSSASTLNVSMPTGSTWHMGVTPQIMSRAVVDPMLAHLETLSRPQEAWDTYLLRLFVDKLNDPDPAERAVVAWTEYDLYWVFAVNAGLWDKYHTHSVLQKYTANLWQWKDFKEWDPCAGVEDDGGIATGFWAVVQSRLGMTGEEIWEQLQPCMRHSKD